MEITVGEPTRCQPASGAGRHWHIPLTIGGQSHVLETTRDEMQAAGPATVGEARASILERLRSRLLESGIDQNSTWAEVQAALNGFSFRL